MAFSFRRMLSNISYFTKPNEENDAPNEVSPRRRHTTFPSSEDINLNFERTEPDSTSKQSMKFPDSVRNFGVKKGSFSDTDILTVNTDTKKRRCKKLKLDIKKASRSMMESLNRSDNEESSNIENTPKHILLNCKSADIFSEKLKKFDFDRSFDISDTDSYTEENIDLDSITDNTDTEISGEETTIKMCRKVDETPSATPESFGDVENKNEEDRMTLLLNYQMKLEKIESFLHKLLSEFEFHIEVSKIFNSKSITTVPTDRLPRILGEIPHYDKISRGVSPWNIIMEKEDQLSKNKLKKQLLSMKENIDNFVKVHFQNEDTRRYLSKQRRSITFDMHKGQRIHKQNKVSIKKKMKHYDFPDLREAMVNLFSTDEERDFNLSLTPVLSIEDVSSPKCTCKCHQTAPSTPIETNQSISSSLGNFTLDSTTLSAYSETLDEMSYNSFQDSSLYSTLLDKSAVERLTFYIQVHSIQINCEIGCGYETKNNIVFFCQSCKVSICDEYDLLKHVLSQKHSEKIHFLYKTAYIKKCVASGQEIMPSTVLNPMTMYRDDNKIVCFGDAVYACSLCFENFIIGESVLMAHCSDRLHVSRRERLVEYFE